MVKSIAHSLVTGQVYIHSALVIPHYRTPAVDPLLGPSALRPLESPWLQRTLVCLLLTDMGQQRAGVPTWGPAGREPGLLALNHRRLVVKHLVI